MSAAASCHTHGRLSARTRNDALPFQIGTSVSSRDFYAPGDWNVACSMCGRKRKASELVKNWQGMYRCPEHNDSRHPQDFVRAVPDVQTVPFAQIPSNTFQGDISATASGSGDAIILTPTVPLGGPFPGQILEFEAVNDNTGAATATLNGTSAAVVDSDGEALTAGDILDGQTYQVTYNYDLNNQEYQWVLSQW